MKIAFISFWSCPLERLGVLASGGMNVYVINLADALGKLGHHVDIYTRTHLSTHNRITKINDMVRVIHISNSGFEMKDKVNDFALKVIRFQKENNLTYDYIHAHYYHSATAAIQIKKQNNTPVFVTFHTLGIMKEKYIHIRDQNRINEEIKICAEATGIIASTEIEKADIVNNYKVGNNKIFVVSPGVNHKIFKKRSQLLSRKKLHLPLKKKIILFVGRIDPVKGLEFLINAIHDLTVKYPAFKNNFQVLLIGEDIKSRHFWQNSEVLKIKGLILSKELCCCIKFLGNKPHNLLPYYYSASDVVVIPSVYESFGLVVLEAMACGTVVVASEVGGLKYLIKDKIDGRLFVSGDIKELGKTLMEVLSNPNKRQKIGDRAMETSRQYCWEKQAHLILNIYKKI
jgi:D-inositol-3-phosphate glycosyltransferase